jgi:hypothetical protein
LQNETFLGLKNLISKSSLLSSLPSHKLLEKLGRCPQILQNVKHRHFTKTIHGSSKQEDGDKIEDSRLELENPDKFRVRTDLNIMAK